MIRGSLPESSMSSRTSPRTVPKTRVLTLTGTRQESPSRRGVPVATSRSPAVAVRSAVRWAFANAGSGVADCDFEVSWARIWAQSPRDQPAA